MAEPVIIGDSVTCLHRFSICAGASGMKSSAFHAPPLLLRFNWSSVLDLQLSMHMEMTTLHGFHLGASVDHRMNAPASGQNALAVHLPDDDACVIVDFPGSLSIWSIWLLLVAALSNFHDPTLVD